MPTATLDDPRGTKTETTVLFLAANPVEVPLLHLGEECRAIEAKIRAAKFRDQLRFRSRWAARPDDLLQALYEDDPAVLHFSGHGVEAQGLCFLAEDGRALLVTSDGLGQVVRAAGDRIQLVVLNACYSRVQAEALVAHVPCVIGMPSAIGDKSAIVYAAELYRALAFGKSVANAHECGLAALALHSVTGSPRDIDMAVAAPVDIDVAEAVLCAAPPELLVQAGIDADSVRIVPDQPSALTRVPHADVRGARGPTLTDRTASPLRQAVDELDALLLEHRRAVHRPPEVVKQAKDRIELLAEQITSSWNVGRGSAVAGAVLERRIGSGNFGTVWYAVDRATGEPRAVKIFHIDKLTVGLMLWRFRRSIRALKRLSERPRLRKRSDDRGSVVTVYEEDESTLAFSMEYLPGGSLEDAAKLGWRLDAKVVAMVKICAAVAYGHENGIVHRDIKPANVGVGTVSKKARTLYLYDFSLASTSLSELRVGTVAYRDPFLPERTMWDHAADRYSAAVTLHEIMTGVRPGRGESGAIEIAAERFDPTVRAGLLAFFQTSFKPAAGDRFEDAKAMRHAWIACFDGRARVETPVPAPDPEPTPLTDDEIRAIAPDTAIAALPLSTRARNALDRAGIKLA